MIRLRLFSMALALVVAWPALSANPQMDILDSIERQIDIGRQREALHSLTTLRQLGDANLVTPRFLYLEARAMSSSGFPEEAKAQLEAIRESPDWQKYVSEEDLLKLELSILKAAGQSVDALKVLEARLPALDEIDPPYPPEATQMHLVYADLLLACLQKKEAVRTLFDLVRNGDPRQKSEIVMALLGAAEGEALDDADWGQLKDILAGLDGMTLWTQFARAAFLSGKEAAAKDLLVLGFEKTPTVVRARLIPLLDANEDPAFTAMLSSWIMTPTAETAAGGSREWLAIKAATLEKSGQTEEALKIIRENLWNEVDLRIRVARMMAAKGDIQGASGIYAELEKGSPGKFLDAWGSMFEASGMTDQALAIWAQIPSKDKRPELGYMTWGRLLKAKGHMREAVEAFKLGIEKTRQPMLFAQELLDSSIQMGDVPGALTAYQSLRNQSQRTFGMWSPERLVDQLKRTQQIIPFSTNLATVLDASETLSASWRDFAVEMATELALQTGKVGILSEWLTHPPKAVAAYWEVPGRKMNHFLGIGYDLSIQGENALSCAYFANIEPASMDARPAALEAAARAHMLIGDGTASLALWERLSRLAKATPDQKLRSSLALARIYLDRRQPGKALETLKANPKLDQTPLVLPEVKFCRAMAYTQLHEKGKAIPLLEELFADSGSHAADAVFWLAEWSLWQRDWDAARQTYLSALSSDPGQALANEALWRLRFLKNLEPEALPAFALGTFFEASGDWKEAEANYRNLASNIGPGELTDWIYFRIGKLLIDSNRRDEGLKQWDILLAKSENPTLALRIQYEKAQLENAPASSFENLMMNHPNTLIGDLARERMNEMAGQDIPAPASEVVP